MVVYYNSLFRRTSQREVCKLSFNFVFRQYMLIEDKNLLPEAHLTRHENVTLSDERIMCHFVH